MDAEIKELEKNYESSLKKIPLKEKINKKKDTPTYYQKYLTKNNENQLFIKNSSDSIMKSFTEMEEQDYYESIHKEYMHKYDDEMHKYDDEMHKYDDKMHKYDDEMHKYDDEMHKENIKKYDIQKEDIFYGEKHKENNVNNQSLFYDQNIFYDEMHKYNNLNNQNINKNNIFNEKSELKIKEIDIKNNDKIYNIEILKLQEELDDLRMTHERFIKMRGKIFKIISKELETFKKNFKKNKMEEIEKLRLENLKMKTELEEKNEFCQELKKREDEFHERIKQIETEYNRRLENKEEENENKEEGNKNKEEENKNKKEEYNKRMIQIEEELKQKDNEIKILKNKLFEVNDNKIEFEIEKKYKKEIEKLCINKEKIIMELKNKIKKLEIQINENEEIKLKFENEINNKNKEIIKLKENYNEIVNIKNDYNLILEKNNKMKEAYFKLRNKFKNYLLNN